MDFSWAMPTTGRIWWTVDFGGHSFTKLTDHDQEYMRTEKSCHAEMTAAPLSCLLLIGWFAAQANNFPLLISTKKSQALQGAVLWNRAPVLQHPLPPLPLQPYGAPSVWISDGRHPHWPREGRVVPWRWHSPPSPRKLGDMWEFGPSMCVNLDSKRVLSTGIPQQNFWMRAPRPSGSTVSLALFLLPYTMPS